MRQQAEHLLRPMGHVPRAGEGKRQGAHRLWRSVLRHLLSALPHRLERRLQVLVHVRRRQVQERRAVAQRQQALSQPSAGVNHARDPGKVAERDQPTTTALPVLHDALIVDQTHVLLQHGVQERHVVRLRLDDVREEAVGAVGNEVLRRHLLDAQNDTGGREVLLHLGPHSCVSSIREHPPPGRLDVHRDALLDQIRHVRWRQRRAPLPLVLHLAEDSDRPGPTHVLLCA
mmetsp:Transcript_26945/g.86628  ORF Transcript_26945/g.86628 Transcript_26945/m.86628 type:complete len:230 (+) Transcript_26945:3805-4494(+)